MQVSDDLYPFWKSLWIHKASRGSASIIAIWPTHLYVAHWLRWCPPNQAKRNDQALNSFYSHESQIHEQRAKPLTLKKKACQLDLGRNAKLHHSTEVVKVLITTGVHPAISISGNVYVLDTAHVANHGWTSQRDSRSEIKPAHTVLGQGQRQDSRTLSTSGI